MLGLAAQGMLVRGWSSEGSSPLMESCFVECLGSSGEVGMGWDEPALGQAYGGAEDWLDVDVDMAKGIK